MNTKRSSKIIFSGVCLADALKAENILPENFFGKPVTKSEVVNLLPDLTCQGNYGLIPKMDGGNW